MKLRAATGPTGRAGEPAQPGPVTGGGYRRDRHGVHRLARPEVVADPALFTRAVRELPPVYWDEVGKVWVCAGYPEASVVLREHTRFRSARLPDPAQLAERGMTELSRIAAMMSGQLLFQDPPQHTAVRAALKPAFTPAAVAAREAEVAGIVDALLATLPRDGPADLIATFAGPLPTRLIASRLRLHDRAAELLRWSEAYETVLGSLATLPHVSDRSVIPTLLEAWHELRERARHRRDQPGDDLITLLAQALCPPDGPPGRPPGGPPGRPPGGSPGGAELEAALDAVAGHCLVLLGGGYQTLTQLVAVGLHRLARHPDQLALLRADPGLIDAAVNEVMRLDGSSQYVARQCTGDVELGGVQLRAGQAVVVLLGAANLDPRQFPDPDRFDLRRGQGRHLGFGLGRHHCAGSLDAEQAARLAILGFLARYPAFSLAAEPISWGSHANTRSPTRLVLQLGPPPTGPAAVPAETAVELAPAELAALRARNDNPVDLAGERMWMDTIAELAARQPDRPAIESSQAGLSYRELDRGADVLALRLQSAGACPGTVVAVVMERSPEAYLAAVAVNRAGAAFLTADTACPPDRLLAMLETARVELVCTQPQLAAELRARLPPGIELITVDSAELAGAADPGPIISGVRPGDTAYVVFTSGSTGAPKAIAIDHEALLNLQVAVRHTYRIQPEDRVLQWFSPNFDGWHGDVVIGLSAGATLVLAPVAATCVGPVLRQLLRERAVTVALLTPTAWQTVRTDDLPALRLAGAAGEVCPAATVRRLAAPGRRVLNLYGPAEAAVWSTWHECHPDEGDPPIGLPVANKRAYVLDPAGRPAGTGEVGELWLAGVGLGRYLRQPALMRQRFRPDPLATRPGQLMYATGDRCRWRADGRLEYVGRVDRQVKLRGQRIELEEVERLLAALPGVTHARAEVEQEQLVATVVIGAGGTFDPDAARTFLRGRLHSAMVPARFRLADHAALTVNGKLEPTLAPAAREPAAQPAPAPAGRPRVEIPAQRRPPAPLDTRTEARLVWRISRLFASCLQLPQSRIRADSDFFDLGGDSLSVAELLAAVEERLAVVLDVDSVVSAATPQAMAHHIQERQPAPVLLMTR